MSDVMLFGVLRMPPDCWIDLSPLDRAQRHSYYVAAADEIERLGTELSVLADAVTVLHDENAAMRTDARRWRHHVSSAWEASEIEDIDRYEAAIDAEIAAIDAAREGTT